jgi:hypothetical protein
LSTNFNELGTSWEIDGGRQVPIGAEMDIKFTIIEKSSKVADSPFYGITEKMEGFATNLTPDAPPGNPIATRVESQKPSNPEYDGVEKNLIDAYNIAIKNGTSRQQIDAIMQRLGTIRRERLTPGALPNRP